MNLVPPIRNAEEGKGREEEVREEKGGKGGEGSFLVVTKRVINILVWEV